MAEEAFQKLKAAMTSLPVLALPDFSKTFVVETDASGHGLGAVLMQDQRPIAYFSQVLPSRVRSKSVYERELMAVVFAVKKWRHYLLGRQFIIRTDQKSLKFFLEQREISLDSQKWLLKLMGYDFIIQYRPGKENSAADALSRVGDSISLCVLSIPQWLQLEDLKKQVMEDATYGPIVQSLFQGSSIHTGYSLWQGNLLYKNKLVLPINSFFISLFLKEYHDGVLGGHSGFLPTYKRLSSLVYWKGMKGQIQRYVAECSICQQHKYSTFKPAGLMQPLPIPELVWQEVSMDFIEGLPTSKGYNCLMVVVDRLSKYGHFVGLSHPFTAVTVAEVCVKEIVRLHGLPHSIVSDCDKIFLSTFWKEIFHLQGTKLLYSTANHPN